MRHIVKIGDALNQTMMLDDNSVDAFIMDPPYASGSFSEAGRSMGLVQGLVDKTTWFDGDGMGTAGIVFLIRNFAFEASRKMKQGGWLLCFCDFRQVVNLVPPIESAGLRFRSLIVWDKGSGGMGTCFRPQYELVMAFSRGSPDVHDATITNLITAKRVLKEKQHPTQKPVDLMAKLIRATTPVDGLVVDPFCGSGTTLVAAALTGRRAIGFERSPDFAQVAINRLAEEAGAASNGVPTVAMQPQMFKAEE
jgi:site-specific DNA-methyltransferase (adenine-specific)